MKWKRKVKQTYIFENSFLIFPRKFNRYWYWLCWVTVQYTWIGWRYSRFNEVIEIGKHAQQYRLDNKDDIVDD